MRFFTNRARGRWLLPPALALIAVGAFFMASAFGVLSGSPSGFESNDGNMTTQTGKDWDTVSGTNFKNVPDVFSSQNDDSYVSGQKQDTACPLVDPTHGNPPKDDFKDVASFSENSSTTPSHTFLYGATIRFAPNGNASENIELKQGTSGTCGAGSNGLLMRTPGDKLLAFDYLNGGTNVDLHVLTWIDGTDSANPTCFVGNDTPPCWGAVVAHPSAATFEGRVNGSPISAGDNPLTNVALETGTFAEFGVDLTASDIVPAGTCKPFSEEVWGTRSSGSSFVSTTKDIAVESQSINTCGEIKIIKQTNPRGIDKVFNFTSGGVAGTSKLPASTTAGGVVCPGGTTAGVATDGSFCLNDKGNSGKTLGSTSAANNTFPPCSDATQCNTVDVKDVQAGTYSVTEGSPGTGFALGSITCTSTGSGTSTTTSGASPTITMGANGVVVCVYQNNQQLGAIKVAKTAKSATCNDATPPSDCSNGKRPLSGAGFEIWKETNGTSGLQTGGATPDTKAANQQLTGSDGTKCFDNLTFGTYYAHESSVPSGYSLPANQQDQSVTINSNSSCSNSPLTVNVENTPLTDLGVDVTSEAGGPATRSKVSCVTGTDPATGTAIGNSPQPATGFADPVHLRADGSHGGGLKPGTYTCTVVIDP